MLVRDLKELYRLECEYYRQEPIEADFTVWKSVLLSEDDREVKRAITIWHSNEEQVESFGAHRAQGSFFPKAADLRAIIRRGQRDERASRKEFKPCNLVQENVDVNGMNWPAVFCSGGHLYAHSSIPNARNDGQNHAVRPLRNCDCWLRYERESAAA